jgi:cell division protein FtsL
MTITWWQSLLISLVTMGAGLIPTLLVLRTARKKTRAEIVDIQEQTIEKMSKRYNEALQRIEEQNKRIEEQTAKITQQGAELIKYAARVAELERGIRILIEQLKKALLDPDWKPDKHKVYNRLTK